MAGIGFTLRKIYNKGDISSLIQATLSGIMIVAGPWLISIVTLTILSQMVFNLVQIDSGVFISSLVYSYAVGLVVFGGEHFIFTRLVADKIYIDQERDGAGIMVHHLIVISLLILVVTIPFSMTLAPEIPYLNLYRAGLVLLFLSINQIWLVMVFNSLLKWYIRIAFVYTLGMGFSIWGAFYLSSRYGTAGAVLSLALGHFFISLGLQVLSYTAYRPTNIWRGQWENWKYYRKFFLLMATGIVYNASIWIDKFLAWILLGTPIPGTPFLMFQAFDLAVFFANLTIIPGLFYFVVFFETDYFVYLKRFLLQLNQSTLRRINQAKWVLVNTTKNHIRELMLLQGVLCLTLIGFIPQLDQFFFQGQTPVSIILFTLVGALFHLLFLTILNLMFYLEMFGATLSLSLIFFCTNSLFALLLHPLQGGIFTGLSFLISTLVVSILGQIIFVRVLKDLDRIMLVRNL